MVLVSGLTLPTLLNLKLLLYQQPSASWVEVGFDADLSASIAADGIVKVSVSASALSFPDLEAARGFVVTGLQGSPITADNNVAAYNNYDSVNGVYHLYLKGTADIADNEADVVYVQQPTDQFRGDFEDGNTSVNGENATIDIPEVNIKMKSEAIVAKTKKLKAVWTPEFAQDLNAYHSLDAEAELTSIMSEYIALEIDLEILGMLIENAPYNRVLVSS